jgi:hypothetical protein
MCAYKLGYAGGFADTIVPPAPVDAGGDYPLHKAKPRRPKIQHREGRAVCCLFAEASASGGVGTGQGRVGLTVAARAYDPLEAEKADMLVIAACLMELAPGRNFQVTWPVGQEDAAWDRYRAEKAEALRRRLLGLTVDGEVPGGP